MTFDWTSWLKRKNCPVRIRMPEPWANYCHPAVERLEDRVTPATLLVNATNSFVSQLQLANQGDTIQIESGGTIGALGAAGTASGTAGSNILTVSTPVVAGQLINITGETSGNPYLVDSTTGGTGPTYTLTLHTALATTVSGTTFTPVANTLGIGKGITIQGDPANPASPLFVGTTLDFFPQLSTVTPSSDSLNNLSLTAVSGTTSSNLSIVNDTFTITSGSTTPISVTSGGALNINSDTFTVGSGASLGAVVAGSTSTGAITFSSDTINITGNLSGTAVDLSSSAGPLTLTTDALTSSGTVGGDGFTLSSTGAVTLSGVTENISGTVTGDGIDVSNAGDLNLAGISVTLGSAVDCGVYADTGGDLVMNGTNTISITGAASGGGVYFDGSANATVSNLTIDLQSNAANGLYIDESGNISLSAANVTVGGNATSYGVYLDASGATTIAGLTLLIDGAADYGLYSYDYGNMSVNGTESITVDGNVGSYGVELESDYGTLTVSTPLSVSLGGTAEYGLYEYATGNLTNSGAVTVTVAGAVSSEGAYLDTEALLSTSAVTVSLASTTSDGLYEYGYTTDINGAINVSVTGAVSGYGAYVESYYGDLTIASTIHVTLGAGAEYGLYLYSDEGSLIDTATGTAPTITVSVAGNVSEEGAYIYASGKLSTAGATSITIGGTADYGLELYSDYNSITDTAGISVSVTGAVSDYGAYIYADTGATLANITVTLADVASGEGLFAEGYYGGLTISTVSVTANDGTSSAYGAYLEAEYAPLVASNITITMNAGAHAGLYVNADGDTSASLTTVSVTVADTGSYGVYAEANSGLTVTGLTVAANGGTSSTYGAYLYSDYAPLVASNVTITMNGAANYGLDAEAQGDSSVSLTNTSITVTGVTSGDGLEAEAESGITLSGTTIKLLGGGISSTDGAYLYNYYNGTVAAGVTSTNLSITIDGAADYGLVVESDYSSISLTTTTISVTGAVSADGIYAYSEYSSLSLTGPTTVTLGSTAAYGMDLEGEYGTTISGPLSATVTGAVADDGIYIYDDSAGDFVCTAAITVNLGSTAEYGLYLYADGGSFTDTGAITVTVGGNVSDYGAYLYAYENEQLGGNVSVSVTGTAEYGLYAETDYGVLSNGGTITVSITGAVSDEGAYFYGDSGATLANISVTLGSTAEYGSAIESSYGNLNVTGLTVQVTGAVTDYGVYLYSEYSGSITTSFVSVSLGSTAEYVLYAYSGYESVSMTGTTLTATGNVSDYGAYIYGSSTATISNLTERLNGASEYGLYVEGYYGGVSATKITLNATGAITDDAVYLETSNANITASAITITLGSTTGDDGFYAIAGQGDLTVTGVDLTTTGLISNDGFELDSQGDLSATSNILVLNGGVTVDALYADSDYNSSPGGNTTITNNQITSDVTTGTGIAVVGTGSLTLTGNTVLLDGGTGDAAALSNASGNPLTIENNSFNTSGLGVGLAFTGGANVVALVEANNFQHNLIGVKITGDGTNAGNIDLGGGALGGTGSNNFNGYTGTAGNYAISLTGTNATSTVFAEGNSFGVANAATLVQDAANNGGTGIIFLISSEDTPAIYNPNTGTWYLSNVNGPNSTPVTFQFGFGGTIGVSGDWFDTGVSYPGLYNPKTGTWYLDHNADAGDSNPIVVQFGFNGTLPVPGNFFGDGYSHLALFINGTWYIDHNDPNSGLGDGSPVTFQFGFAGAQPVAGSWFGSGPALPGLYNPSNGEWYLDHNQNAGDANPVKFQFGGMAGAQGIAGNWFGTATTYVGLYSPNTGTWYLNNTQGPNSSPLTFQYGGMAGSQGVPGVWNVQLEQAAGGPQTTNPSSTVLTQSQLNSTVTAALERLHDAGVDSTLVADLSEVHFEIGQLPPGDLGLANLASDLVEVSPNAAGYGWFVDPTAPTDGSGPASFHGIDLLTVVLHELGHYVGLTDLPASSGNNLMDGYLGVGQRRDVLTAFYTRHFV